MKVFYIVTTKYANGDDYADKFETLTEVAEAAKFIDSKENRNLPDEDRLIDSQFAVTTEER